MVQALEASLDALQSNSSGAADLRHKLGGVEASLVGMAEVLHVPVVDGSNTRHAFPQLHPCPGPFSLSQRLLLSTHANVD